MADLAFTEHDLFQTMRENADINLFWKDKERRFMGASKSFLNFYGLKGGGHSRQDR